MRRVAYDKLNQLIHYAESHICRWKILLEYFGESYEAENCQHCDNCMKNRQVFDGTIIAQQLLSCIFRLNERFGMQYGIDVLEGAKSERNFKMATSTYRPLGSGLNIRRSNGRYTFVS